MTSTALGIVFGRTARNIASYLACYDVSRASLLGANPLSGLERPTIQLVTSALTQQLRGPRDAQLQPADLEAA